MTTAKLAHLVGQTGLARVSASNTGTNFIRVEVEVIDAKSMFGRLDVFVRPVAGEGEAWMSADNVQGLEMPKPEEEA